jgi:hypothetical protein
VNANNAADADKFKEEAIKNFTKVLELEPDNADAKSFMTALQATPPPSK